MVVISDTHGKHDRPQLPEGDVLIHCGDFCHGFGEDPAAVERIDSWFGEQPFETVLCTGGNHERKAERYDVRLRHGGRQRAERGASAGHARSGITRPPSAKPARQRTGAPGFLQHAVQLRLKLGLPLLGGAQ